MTDLVLIRQAESLGRVVFWQDDRAWHAENSLSSEKVFGPFQSIDAAAIDAIAIGEELAQLRGQLQDAIKRSAENG